MVDIQLSPAPMALKEVLDPAWLSQALSQGRELVSVQAVEVVETLGPSALKIRLVAEFGGSPPADIPKALCIKGIFDPRFTDYLKSGAQEAEANFYRLCAAQLNVRVPRAVYSASDPETRAGVTIMEDLVPQGARFLTALSPYAPEQAKRSLDQLARLHGGSWETPASDMPWIVPKLASIAAGQPVAAARVTEVLQGPRGAPLPQALRSGDRIYAAVRALAARGEALDSCYIHGDAHAGNVYEIGGELGLIDWQLLQRGHWSLDIAYHIAAALTIEDRRRHETDLLRYYLEALTQHGGKPPAWDEAWLRYREAVAYGFLMWAITMRVDPAITDEFVARLGTATADLDTFGLLGV